MAASGGASARAARAQTRGAGAADHAAGHDAGDNGVSAGKGAGGANATAVEASWRADISTFVANRRTAQRSRVAGAAGGASRGGAGLSGPLAAAMEDKWRDGDPSSPAARNMQALRTAARAR
eukprot:4524879-Pleurochrysis_carterae.AAC.1